MFSDFTKFVFKPTKLGNLFNPNAECSVNQRGVPFLLLPLDCRITRHAKTEVAGFSDTFACTSVSAKYHVGRLNSIELNPLELHCHHLCKIAIGAYTD